MARDILDVLTQLRDQKQPCAIATVVETVGSVSAKTGSKAVIDEGADLTVGQKDDVAALAAVPPVRPPPRHVLFPAKADAAFASAAGLDRDLYFVNKG